MAKKNESINLGSGRSQGAEEFRRLSGIGRDYLPPAGIQLVEGREITNVFYDEGKAPGPESELTESTDNRPFSAASLARAKQKLAEQSGSDVLAEGKKKKSKWIQKMHMKKGALHSKLGVPEGEKIPKGKIAKAAKAGGKLGKEAKLAQTLAKLNKGSKAVKEGAFGAAVGSALGGALGAASPIPGGAEAGAALGGYYGNKVGNKVGKKTAQSESAAETPAVGRPAGPHAKPPPAKLSQPEGPATDAKNPDAKQKMFQSLRAKLNAIGGR